MKPPSSSTFSSDPRSDAGDAAAGGGTERPAGSTGGNLREALVVAAWLLFFLAAADVMINRLFPLPRDPRVETKGQFARYFNYGWSIEAKIRREVGPSDETSFPLMLAGWIDRDVADARAAPKPPPGRLVVSSYGMSFAKDIAKAMAELDPTIHLRLFSAPAAPASHSYATYLLDRGGPSKVVILGVLASSVKALATNNAMTWQFEGPAPYTYPRYFVRASGLEADWPSVRSLGDLRARLANPAGWEEFVSQIRASDGFYNGLLFQHDISDYSVIARMVRKAAAQRWLSSRAAQVHGPSGYVLENPLMDTLREIIAAFAATARRDGKLPVAVLIEDRGFRDHLYQAVEPVLSRDRIPHVSTHIVCPDTNPRNFTGDNHFSHEANLKIGQAVLDVIRRELAAKGG
jgi:hypothetical protein